MSDVISVKNVTKWYIQKKVTKQNGKTSKKQTIKAVDGVTFSLQKGETLGVIGESGCGKSTLGKLLIALEDPTTGDILINGTSTKELIKKDRLAFRRMVQMIFQNPFDTFDPRYTIYKVFMSALELHNIGKDKEEREKIIVDTLEKGGLVPAADYLARYPHELSGGQLQRISILRSMLLNPLFLVADEPVSMLDVSIRADIINMLQELTTKKDTTLVFISHDIATTRYISQKVAVMYLGRIVEMGLTDEVLHNPQHPYTKVLISNCASLDPLEKREIIHIEGEPPTPINNGPGCYFAPRCYKACERCFKEYPEFTDLGNGHIASCFNLMDKKE
ncbi:oligopeptide/dipeptide ABC transporter ATP-binding protein [Clostridium polynesiense]|uniref:oligopeptide/dipeptide ABC transporter ATP-binding protein n=1 Tax=Clostridium polynesiense TaxID=1325933 RepID=UPI00058EC2B3|nr:ABC transporter ATP-binding protein [Clostridium polynesiense]